MENDIIKSWKCWHLSDKNDIIEMSSTTHCTDDIPADRVQAMRLWFIKENTSRFINGRDYIIFNTPGSIVGQPSSCIIQADEITEDLAHLRIKKSINISEDLAEKIFYLMFESVDPTL